MKYIFIIISLFTILSVGSQFAINQEKIVQNESLQSNQLQTEDYKSLLELTQQYVQNQTFPGSQISIFSSEENLHTQLDGKLTYDDQAFSTEVNEETMYDMASLTKVISTTSAAMHLYELGSLSLMDKMVKFLPQADNNGKGEITIQNLLLHNAGLYPDYTGDVSKLSKEEFLNWLMNCELMYPIGTKSVYSDLSMVFLQLVIEEITGIDLYLYVESILFSKLQMTKTMYQPSVAYQSAGYCAPTEYDTNWRMMLLRCVVHDPTAYVMGGISGNAGVFSYYKDATKFMQMMLNLGTYQGKKIFNASTVKLFTTRVTGLPYANTRALGWDTCGDGVPVSCGQNMPSSAFGHTGYTGTSLWGSLKDDFGVAILTNRVYPNDNAASKSAIQWFRNNAMNMICDINGISKN